MAATSTALRPAQIAHDDFTAWLDGYTNVHIDMGTGDGTFALQMARRNPDTAVIGIDTCLDNLTKAARKPAANLRFLSCDATAIPPWLRGTATWVSINFPYGSLLHAVAGEDRDTLERMLAVARMGTRVDIRVNGSAGEVHGLTVEDMARRMEAVIRRISPCSASITIVPQHTMRAFPSTWAKRLAYGKPSQVIVAAARIGV